MRARWRRYVGLAFCACWLPLTLRLLLLGRSYSGATLQLADDANDSEITELDLPATRRDAKFPYAGAYMDKQKPDNLSYCRWQYELPAKLVYLEQQLIASPGSGGTGGPHGVLPFVVRGIPNPSEVPQVTYCSHATAEQVYNIVELARRWEGPLSLSVFSPGRDLGLVAQLLELACHCEPGMSRVSVHLIFPRERPPVLGAGRPESTDNCGAGDLQRLAGGANGTERHRLGLSYPINVARNVARALAPSQRVLVSDIELLPSEKLASRFDAMLFGRSLKRTLVFVLPVFEVDASINPPENKRQLLAVFKTGLGHYFHRYLCPHCQRFPGLFRWILRPDPGRAKPLTIARREYPHNRWEPIFIGSKHDPLYAEEMSWEGQQDKMTQMFEMCLMNYRLIVLDGAFLVHTPGIKYKPATSEQQQQRADLDPQRAHVRLNERIYQRLTRSLVKRYPVNHRCKP